MRCAGAIRTWWAGVMLGVCASGLLEDALKKLETKRPEEEAKSSYLKSKRSARRKIKKIKNFRSRARNAAPGSN
jgi:hypothetical protein